MNFTQFINWIKNADIDAKYKVAILNADLSSPGNYIDLIRKQLNDMVVAGVVSKYNEFSLGQVYEMLDPAKISGKSFYQSIPGVSAHQNYKARQQSSFSDVKKLLADPKALNDAISSRDVLRLPVGEYLQKKDFLGYLCDEGLEGFRPDHDFQKNASRISEFLIQAFNEDELKEFGYTEDAIQTGDINLLREVVLLEAAMYAVESMYTEEDAALNADLSLRDDINEEQREQLIGNLKSSWAPIREGGSLKGKLGELVGLLRQVVIKAQYPDIDGIDVAYNEYKAELEKLQAVVTHSSDQEMAKQQYLDNLAKLETSMKGGRQEPAEVRALYDEMTRQCASSRENLSRMADREVMESAKIAAQRAVRDALQALSNLYDAVNNPQPETPARRLDSIRDLLKRKGAAEPVDPDKIYDQLLKPFNDVYEAMALLVPAGAGGDEYVPILMNVVDSIAANFSDIFSNRDFFKFLERRDIYSKISNRGDGNTIFIFGSLFDVLSIVRIKLLWEEAKSHGNISKLTVDEIGQIYQFRRNELAQGIKDSEFKQEPFADDERLLKAIEEKFTLLDQFKAEYSEEAYKIKLLNLAREASGMGPIVPNPHNTAFEAALDMLKLHAVSDSRKTMAEVLIRGSYTDEDLKELIRSRGFENSGKDVNKAMGEFVKLIAPYLGDRDLFRLTDDMVRLELATAADPFRNTTLAKPLLAVELERNRQVEGLPPAFLAHMQKHCLPWKEKESRAAIAANKKIKNDDTPIRDDEVQANVNRGMNSFIAFNILGPAEDCGFMSLDALRSIEDMQFDVQIRDYDGSGVNDIKDERKQAEAEKYPDRIEELIIESYQKRASNRSQPVAAVTPESEMVNLKKMGDKAKLRKDLIDIRVKLASAESEEERMALNEQFGKLIAQRDALREGAVPVMPAMERADIASPSRDLPKDKEEYSAPKVVAREEVDESSEDDPIIMYSEDDADIQPSAPSLEDARSKALNIMLRLQRLPAAGEMTVITDDVANFYQAILELNRSIPGGSVNPIEFAENLMSALPSHVSLYSDGVLDQIDKIHSLYESVDGSSVFQHFVTELWQAANTKMRDMDGHEEPTSKRQLAERTPAAWKEIEAENSAWNRSRIDQRGESEQSAKIESLSNACDEYMQHLGRKLYEGIRDHDFELCKTLVFRDETDNKLKFRLSDLMDIVIVNDNNIRTIRSRDPAFDMAIKKYQAVKEMKATLSGEQSSGEKLNNFQGKFLINRQTIERRRDSAAIKFLKVLATVFTFGIAAAAGLWKVKGKQFSDKLDGQLAKPENHKPK